MKFEIKNSKHCEGLDGVAWSATLYIDGVRACMMINDGNGGPLHQEWTSEALRQRFQKEYVDTLPLDHSYPEVWPEGWKKDAETALSELVDNHEEEKQLRRWCRKQICFRVKGDKEGSWRTLKVGPERLAEAKAFLQKKYGDTVEEILNERFL